MADEVATRLRVTRAWVLGEARAGRLAHYRLNRKVRFTWDQVEAFLVAREAGRAPGAAALPTSVRIPAALFPDGVSGRGTVNSHRGTQQGAR